MNKGTFIEILEAALLTFDGATEEELTKKYGINTRLAHIGVVLCQYLKQKELEII